MTVEYDPTVFSRMTDAERAKYDAIVAAGGTHWTGLCDSGFNASERERAKLAPRRTDLGRSIVSPGQRFRRSFEEEHGA